eukprot:TRINITY_DN8770_c0_g1_i1.p1 TRINITY_DN8770_c0_g1~~TRINITY_DN8770_c0_g1_i1.p1  ORF type:complete len:328 (+),score=87.25 TRINITY_DN8770_c0_g1_i1:504-1487(+)
MSENTEKELRKTHVMEAHDLEQAEIYCRNSRLNPLDNKDIDSLCRRIRTTDCMLSYLKSKARIMCMPGVANRSCGIKYEQGVGYVDRNGTPMADWCNTLCGLSKEADTIHGQNGTIFNLEKNLLEQTEEEYVEQTAKDVMLVSDAMEVLLKRTIIAEAERTMERKRANETEDLVKRKALQIESMWTRVEEMEEVSKGTRKILKEMQGKLDDMERETSRQRQRATENEQELSRVRHDFEALRSNLENLTGVRESLLSSVKRIEEMEIVLERLTDKATRLESSNKQKEMEIRNLMEVNHKLRASLDTKEAELSASREQCKILILESQRK